MEEKYTPNPQAVDVRGREYLVWFNDNGKPRTVMVIKSHGQQAHIPFNGPTARAAIAKAMGAA